MNPQILEELLFEPEGNTLDFKREHYMLTNATDHQKSEILKDILAFANAWRRTDAYIILGVEENQGGRAKVLGISFHIDEASIQQFINSKTNRPIEFSYEVITYESKLIAIIKIPIQQRPLFSLKDYGKVKKDTVYIRRGSATIEANPDEIMRMGEDIMKSITPPIIELQFADERNQISLGQEVTIESFIMELPDRKKIPDFGSNSNIYNFNNNIEYYRRFADFFSKASILRPIVFVAYNPSSQNAINVNIKIDIEMSNGLLVCENWPRQPSTSLPDVELKSIHEINNKKFEVEELNNKWLLTLRFGNIQPKLKVWSKPMYIGATENFKLNFSTYIYADNLPNPLSADLTINVICNNKGLLSMNDFLKIAEGKQ